MRTPLQQAAELVTDMADALGEIRAVLKQHQQSGRAVVRIRPTDVDTEAELLKQLLYALEAA